MLFITKAFAAESDSVFDTIAKTIKSKNFLEGIPTKFTLGSFLNQISNIIMAVGFSISIVTLALAMFMYVTSGGNPDKTKKASDSLWFSIIAAAVSIGMFTFRKIVLGGLLGIDDTSITEGVIDY